MELSFRSTCRVDQSDDPTLAEVLKDCEIHADIEVQCEAEYEGAYFTSLEIEGIDFVPPDSDGAVRAQALMHPELMENIKREIERTVQRDWDEYERQAEDHYRDMEDEAADQMYERWKEEG